MTSPTVSPIKKIEESNFFDTSSSSSDLNTTVNEISISGRGKILINFNETVSVIPKLFLKSTIKNPEEDISFMDYFKRRYWDREFTDIPKEKQKKIIQKYLLGLPISKVYTPSIEQKHSDIKLAKLLKVDIENHFDMHIQLYFLMLTTSYKTQVFFDVFRTFLQAGLKNTGCSFSLVEAHSHFLPTLSWITLKDKQEHFFNDEKNLNEIKPNVYGAYSSFLKHWNTTSKLPLFVNEVDTSLERFHTFNGLFRDYCVTILNYNATGDLNPETGLIRFLNTLKEMLNTLKANHENGSEKDIVLSHYLEVTDSCIKQVADKTLFKKLTLNYYDELDAKFYEKRQKDLQQRMNAEIILWKEIEILEEKAFEIIDSSSITDKDAFMRCILLTVKKVNKDYNLLEKSITEILGKTGWKHFHNCKVSQEVAILCQEYLKDKSFKKIANELTQITTLPVYKPLSTLIVENCGVKPQKIELIAKNILCYHAERSLETFKIQSFINLDSTWAENYLKNPTFSQYIEACLNNEDFVTQCRVLNTNIEKHLNLK